LPLIVASASPRLALLGDGHTCDSCEGHRHGDFSSSSFVELLVVVFWAEGSIGSELPMRGERIQLNSDSYARSSIARETRTSLRDKESPGEPDGPRYHNLAKNAVAGRARHRRNLASQRSAVGHVTRAPLDTHEKAPPVTRAPSEATRAHRSTSREITGEGGRAKGGGGHELVQ
jgi:hypothetical protein